MGEFVIPKAGRIQGSPWAPLHLLDSHEYHGGNGAEWRGWVLQSSGEGMLVPLGSFGGSEEPLLSQESEQGPQSEMGRLGRDWM